jgi:glycosyltransferase involved in cell wall biosynthesis
MKIVHLAENMEVGGAEKLISLLCQWQRQQGHDPSVHCLYSVGALGEELRKDGFNIVLHDSSGIGGRPASVYRKLKQYKPEIVHCHNATATILGALPASAAGTKGIIVTRHGIVAPPYLLRREIKFAFASRWCDWVVAVCEQARNNLIAAPFASREKIVCIYNAAQMQHRNGSKPPMKLGFTLLHVGRLSPAKDQETLLKAFAIAKAKTPDLQLWIVGGGRLRQKLENLAREIGIASNVTFFGEQADVSPFLNAADLFILSSVTEGVPVSLLEALAASLPAVVTDVGGMSEVARLSDSALTVPPSNAGALADAIEKMAKSRDQFAPLRKRARECYMANFTVERMGSEYMTLYTTACA